MIQNLTRDHRFGWWFETSPGKISSRVVFTSWVFWNQILGAPIVRKKGSSGTNDLAVIGVTRRKPEKKRSVSHGVESRGSTKMNLGFDFKWNFLGMFFVWLCLVWKKYTMCGSSLFVGNVFDGPRYSMYCVYLPAFTIQKTCWIRGILSSFKY